MIRSMRPRRCSTGSSGLARELGGIWGYYKMLAEKCRERQAARERRVRFRVPPGIGGRNMLLLNVAAGGAVEMSEAEAEAFRAGGQGGSGMRQPMANRRRASPRSAAAKPDLRGRCVRGLGETPDHRVETWGGRYLGAAGPLRLGRYCGLRACERIAEIGL